VTFAAGVSWTKVGAAFSRAGSSLPSIYWPWVVDTAGLPITLADRYAMYYSTDHDATAGGVALATAPDPTGPWTDRGRVFVDAGPGHQTETPAVWWDPAVGVLRMLYQQAGAVGGVAQSTLQATSSDGIHWSKLPTTAGIIVQPGTFPGDGHTGYAIPLPRPDAPRCMTAWHLMGGGNRPHFGMSHSFDYGATWKTDPRPLMYGMDQVNPVAPGYRIEWNSGHQYQWQGRTWWVGLLSSFGSGAGAVPRVLAQAPLAPDGRHLLGVPELVFPGDAPANHRALFCLSEGSTLWLWYQIDQVFYLARGAA
jgi:hypothetical protein